MIPTSMPLPTIRATQAGCLTVALLAAAATLSTSVIAPRASTGAAATCVAGSPCLTAMPGTSLADGQVVKLTFTGYPAGVGIGFLQCRQNPVSVSADCTPVSTTVIGVTDANGGGSAYLPVSVGNNIPNGAGGNITCDAQNPCVIEGLVDTSDLTSGAAAALQFAKSPDDCPPFPSGGLLGVGSASAFRAVYAWEFAQCLPPADIAVDYALKASPDGVFDFQQGLVDFGVTGPFQTAPTVPPGGTPFALAPISTSAVVLAFRMWDMRGPEISHLVLTPDLVAQIFQGTIANLAASPAVAALNPGVQFPPRLLPYARAESSAQSLVFTSWLAAQAPTTWTGGVQSIFPVTNTTSVFSRTGSTAVGLAVAVPGEDPTAGQAQIGYMDSSTAAFYGLPTVTIQQSDGSQVDATPATIAAAIARSPVAADGTLTLDYAHPNPSDYPMPMPAYMMVPTAATATMTPDRGLKLANFLRYAVQTGQTVLPPGYTPLPANLVSESLAVANAIPQPPPATPTPSASPTPTAPATSPPAATATPTPAAAGERPVGPTLPTSVSPALGILGRTSPPLGTNGGAPGRSGTSCTAGPATPGASASPTARAPSPRPGASPPAAIASSTTPKAVAPVTPCPSAAAVASAGAATPKPSVGVTPFRLNLSHLADSTFARWVLPPLLALGLLALLAGVGLEIHVRRRSFLAAAGAASTAGPAAGAPTGAAPEGDGGS